QFLFLPDPATSEIYTLSLHDALPIWWQPARFAGASDIQRAISVSANSRSLASVYNTARATDRLAMPPHALRKFPSLVRFISGGQDRKSTRLNSSHVSISYAVFCLKKK